MLIIGCDFHTRYQQIAMMDQVTGRLAQPSVFLLTALHGRNNTTRIRSTWSCGSGFGVPRP
jgi:hypothetical protein